MPTSITIDASACNHCGACVRECPVHAMIERASGAPKVASECCIDCGHCGAVCAIGAISSKRGTFPEWKAPNLDADTAKQFLLGRRSVRRYRNTAIDGETVAELLSVGPYAPTASNAQDVTAMVLSGESVHGFATLVNDYYHWLVRLLGRRLLWPLLWFTALRPYLKNPGKIATVRERVRGFSRENDWIFFGAPVVIVLSAPRKNKLFGRANCYIAAERIMQYAAAQGLGSCYIGFADVAMSNRKSIAQELGLQADHVPQVVFTLGHPAVTYHRLPARRPMPVTWKPA